MKDKKERKFKGFKISSKITKIIYIIMITALLIVTFPLTDLISEAILTASQFFLMCNVEILKRYINTILAITILVVIIFMKKDNKEE